MLTINHQPSTIKTVLTYRLARGVNRMENLEAEDLGLRRIGNLTAQTVSSPQALASTLTRLQPNSATTGSRYPAPKGVSSAGTALSKTAAANLPSVAAAMALFDPEKVDRALAASLPRSVASACQARWTDTIGAHGWDGQISRYELVTMPPERDLDAASAMIEATLKPAAAKVVKSELARLRATTISRNTEASDLALTFAAYADALTEYPADVVVDTCRYWGRNEKWWPALAELRSRMDRKFRRRKLLAAAIAEAYAHHLDGQTRAAE